MSRFNVTIKPSTTESASSTSATFEPFPATGNDEYHAAVFALDVSAVTGTLPTLDVWVQLMMPNDTWSDLVAFARMSGAGTRIATIIPLGPPEISEAALSNKGLSLGSVRTFPLANNMRVVWDIGGTAGQSFTFAVKADLYASPVPELGH